MRLGGQLPFALWNFLRQLPLPRLPRRWHCRLFRHTPPPLNERWWSVDTNWRGDYSGFSFCARCGEVYYFTLSREDHDILRKGKVL